MSGETFTNSGLVLPEGAAMGSPVSPVIANLYMEFLEQQVIATAPVLCMPRLWKRYVDDILEIVNEDQVDNLTEHLNHTDPTDIIKFTYEKDSNNSIPFLENLIVRKLFFLLHNRTSKASITQPLHLNFILFVHFYTLM